MKIPKVFFYLLILTALISSCKAKQATKNTYTSSISSDENFDKFYNRFHADSAFQISRIVFPLDGMYTNGHEEKRWDKKNWVIIKTRIYDIDTTDFKVDYKKTENTFTQKVWVENSGFASQCRFELIKKKWHLVYFLDQNL
ncbi:MAG: DUF4348 domain-containing protein [Bacteroidales bacterium]|jgi:hypothetical protein|nr:DUF4348 domain-containing protein [Bacteroidales bacterium]MDD4385468.1 DUF4348 domain-containing protein [Bacteroidales bacterium]MDY0196426.1 DUF4348 domain-containing protein [Tenuifilaceae bacterium]